MSGNAAFTLNSRVYDTLADREGTVTTQPSNAGGAGGAYEPVWILWDGASEKTRYSDVPSSIQIIPSARESGSPVRSIRAAAGIPPRTPRGSETSVLGLINAGHIRTADDLARMESVTDCLNHDFRGRAGVPMYDMRLPIGTGTLRTGSDLLSAVAGGAERSDMSLVQYLHARGTHLCPWSGFDVPTNTVASFEDGVMYTGNEVGANLDLYLRDAVSRGAISCLYDSCNMQAVRDAVGRNDGLRELLLQVVGDAASLGADRGGSIKGMGSETQQVFEFPMGGLHQRGIGFVEGIDYTVSGGRIHLSITQHERATPFEYEFGRTEADHIPSVEEITQLLSHVNGAGPSDLSPSSRALLGAIDRFAVSQGVQSRELTQIRIAIIACLKPQADESRTLAARELLRTGKRPVVFTGDLRAFYSCAKKNITAIFVSSTKCLYYKRKEDGGFMALVRNITQTVVMSRAGQAVLRLFRMDAKSKKEYLEKKSKALKINDEIKTIRRAIDKKERELAEARLTMKKHEDEPVGSASYARLRPSAARDLAREIADAEKVIEDKKREIEKKEAKIIELIGKKLMAGGGDDDTEEELSVQLHVQIVRVMAAYLLNNLTRLLSENIHETMPDVVIHIVPLFTIVPDDKTITDYVNPNILDRSGNSYVNNFEFRMPILEVFDQVINPCMEGGDINECVDTFMKYAGYFLDEPVVGVLKRVMQGEVVSDAEIEDPAFNGIDVISSHETMFKFMRPPVAGKKRGRPDDFVPSTPLRAPGDRGEAPHPLAGMLTPEMPSTFSIEERSPPSTIRRPDEEEISGGGSASSATRRRQRRRQQKKLRTQKKASRLGGLRATFEIVPH